MSQLDMFPQQLEQPPSGVRVHMVDRPARRAQPTPAPAAAQLDLAVPVLRTEPRRLGGMPRSVEAKWELAKTVEVRQAFLDVAMQRPGEWIDGGRFYAAVAIPFDIGCCWGHAMGAMARAGLLEVKNHYYGSDHPGKPGYKGYNHIYRWHPPMPGEAHA